MRTAAILLLVTPASACERARGPVDAPAALILSGGGAKGALSAKAAAAAPHPQDYPTHPAQMQEPKGRASGSGERFSQTTA